MRRGDQARSDAGHACREQVRCAGESAAAFQFRARTESAWRLRVASFFAENGPAKGICGRNDCVPRTTVAQDRQQGDRWRSAACDGGGGGDAGEGPVRRLCIRQGGPSDQGPSRRRAGPVRRCRRRGDIQARDDGCRHGVEAHCARQGGGVRSRLRLCGSARRGVRRSRVGGRRSGGALGRRCGRLCAERGGGGGFRGPDADSHEGGGFVRLLRSRSLRVHIRRQDA